MNITNSEIPFMVEINRYDAIYVSQERTPIATRLLPPQGKQVLTSHHVLHVKECPEQKWTKK